MAFDVQSFQYGLYGNQGKNWERYGRGATQDMFGWADVEAARSQGATKYQAWQLLDRARRERAEQQAAGWRGNTPGSENPNQFALAIGPGVEQRLKDWTGGRPSEPGGHKFGDYGGWGFGMKDIEAVGVDNLDRIKELRDFAILEGIGVGDKVAPHISMLERDRRHENTQQELLDKAEANAKQRAEEQRIFNEKLWAKQEADHAEALRIQTEANEAAALFQEQQAAKGRRIQSSNPTGVGGAATIKGSRLSITEAGGRKGARRFARPNLQYMNTLGMGINSRAINTKTPITL